MARIYRKTARSLSEQATRRRIVDAAIALHQEVGPRATTVSAIAQRAGVQRLTVYRHFPDEHRLFEACTSGWLERNPPPDPAAWLGAADPLDRCRRALRAFYDYYTRTADMWRATQRDEADVPALQAPMADFREMVIGVADALARGFPEGGTLVRATIRHALAFNTWADLATQAPDVEGPADLACCWIQALVDRRSEFAGPSPQPPRIPSGKRAKSRAVTPSSAAR